MSCLWLRENFKEEKNDIDEQNDVSVYLLNSSSMENANEMLMYHSYYFSINYVVLSCLLWYICIKVTDGNLQWFSF